MSRVKPIRIQRKRVKGWKMPPNTVSVTRPQKWGNPFKVGECVKLGNGGEIGMMYMKTTIPYSDESYTEIKTAQQAVDIYEKYLQLYPKKDILELRGKNLACFCPLDKPCHADVLLKIANE